MSEKESMAVERWLRQYLNPAARIQRVREDGREWYVIVDGVLRVDFGWEVALLLQFAGVKTQA